MNPIRCFVFRIRYIISCVNDFYDLAVYAKTPIRSDIYSVYSFFWTYYCLFEYVAVEDAGRREARMLLGLLIAFCTAGVVETIHIFKIKRGTDEKMTIDYTSLGGLTGFSSIVMALLLYVSNFSEREGRIGIFILASCVLLITGILASKRVTIEKENVENKNISEAFLFAMSKSSISIDEVLTFIESYEEMKYE